MDPENIKATKKVKIEAVLEVSGQNESSNFESGQKQPGILSSRKRRGEFRNFLILFSDLLVIFVNSLGTKRVKVEV